VLKGRVTFGELTANDRHLKDGISCTIETASFYINDRKTAEGETHVARLGQRCDDVRYALRARMPMGAATVYPSR